MEKVTNKALLMAWSYSEDGERKSNKKIQQAKSIEKNKDRSRRRRTWNDEVVEILKQILQNGMKELK